MQEKKLNAKSGFFATLVNVAVGLLGNGITIYV